MGKRGPEPKKQNSINWDEVEKLFSYQCTNIEVAAFFDVSLETLERACLATHGIKLAEFSLKKKAVGRVKLRKAQLEHVAKGIPGWAPVAIYLDKKMFPDERIDLPSPLDDNRSQLQKTSGIRTFKEFCIEAGYFEPYAKQEEMRAFGMDEDDTRLLLGARGYGKTDFVTIMGVGYDLYVAYEMKLDMSEHTNLIITKSKSRNTAICEEIAQALIKNGVPLEKSNASVIRVQGLIGQDHSVEAITIKTSMRGRHPKRIVMDDPVTDEDVSEAMRTTVKRRYDEAYKLCKNIVIIGQPAHYDDLYANLRGIIKTMEVPHGSIPELDVDLEAMKLAGVDPTSIEMSYHLKVPMAGQSTFANLKFIDHFPSGDSVAFLDPSDGGDYSALSIIKGQFDGVAVFGKAWKKAWYHCLEEIVEALVSKGVRRLCFETNKHGNQPIDQLQNLLAQYGIGVTGKHSDSNKHAAIQAAGSYAHMIYLSKDSDKTYTDQVIKYEYKAKFDDAPDSLARGLEWLGLLRGRK